MGTTRNCALCCGHCLRIYYCDPSKKYQRPAGVFFCSTRWPDLRRNFCNQSLWLPGKCRADDGAWYQCRRIILLCRYYHEPYQYTYNWKPGRNTQSRSCIYDEVYGYRGGLCSVAIDQWIYW